MDVRYLLLLFFLASCMPTSQVAKGNLSSNSGNGDNLDNGVIPVSPTQWNFLGNLTKTITINVSNLNNSYIVGHETETFLNSSTTMSQDYCLVSRYSINNINHELRSRVVPISYYDFTAKRTIRIFRVDFNDSTNSQSICVGNSFSPFPVLRIDSSGVLGVDPDSTVAAQTTYLPSALCPTCSSPLSSSKMFITKKGLGQLEELKLVEVDIRSLSLMIDPNNNGNSNVESCSNSYCAARGFDCCLDNQCITDGATRPSAVTNYSSELQAAEQERFNNPLAYLNYPHLYYVCGSSVPSTTGGSSGGSYVQGLTQLKKDYFCVEHMKKFKTGPTFHQDVLASISTNLSFFPDDLDIPDINAQPATLYPADIECRNEAAPNSDMYYRKVTERLYQNCGCSKTNLSEMIQYCPAYEYSVNYFEPSGLPNRIDCYTPPSTVVDIPSQQTVSVNSRSAPHRYFRKCGDEFGSNAPCATGNEQEGDTFFYQDSENILPFQENFGMNSILGQMNVTLDKAVPAKTVAVELDQVYQISTTSGFYSPCPTCGKDKWFSSFSPYPTTAYGTGLQAVGHSTERDAFGFNSTGGNYEDTIFGRACWIPPTMLPFSHYPNGDTQTQRLDRLKTQAALYANGYQRDWFGFNKGALIGSFDGVSWFAVGKGRIVRSTTKKLFLAINAPFADLATPTLHVVNVQAYDGITQAAQVDYDPQYHLSHPYQNEAGNCQANHLCSTDTDCISRLGWEYMCADVQDKKTLWPQFDADGNELANTPILNPGPGQPLPAKTIDQILHQKKFPSASTKRCVYRGAGAICHTNSQLIGTLNKRKTFTCAPNFYCANVNAGGSLFNSKVSRYASNLEDIPVIRNHLYGKDANVLGRPLSYTSSNSTLTTNLPNEVKTNLIQNFLHNDGMAQTSTGICLPGKLLPNASNQNTDPFTQHMAADASRRTDYINQIASCNSGLFTANRYASCPVINSAGDYEHLTAGFNGASYNIRARHQNSCGLDTLLNTANLSASAETLSDSSPFRAIEGKLLSATTISGPSVARDACLRRAGQVCHTDLDCGPNKLHADQVDNFNLDYFGNQAEKQYYTEYLVCGQQASKPTPSSSTEYKNFNMNKNRCCREVGSDLTTYSSYLPNKILTSGSSDYEAVSYGLLMTQPPGMPSSGDPTKYDAKRYSRLATVENLGTAERPPLSAFQNRDGAGFIQSAEGANVLTEKQWKTLTEANSESCCGGGWIRKFSDGSNDWSRRDRVYMDVDKFKCINSRTALLTKPTDYASQYDSVQDLLTLLNQDIGDYCKDATGTKGSCAQFTITDSQADVAPSAPSADINSSHMQTALMTFGSAQFRDFYFYPKSADGDSATIMDLANGRANISIKLPSFYPRTAFDRHYAAKATYCTTFWDKAAGCNAASTATGYGGPNASVVYLFNATTGAPIGAGWNYWCTIDTNATKLNALAALTNPNQSNAPLTYCSPTADGNGQGCCHHYDPATRTLKVIPKNFADPNLVGIKIGVGLSNGLAAGGQGLGSRRTPGTSTHYLKKLGKLELSGIPQITYEKLMCNDSANRIVPGLFKHPTSTDLSVSEFDNPNYSFKSAAAPTKNYTNYHALDHEPVFSANDFKCCTPLGKSTNSVSKCCSGSGTVNPSGVTYTCDLPAGVDLMVYFNRFVSNEGQGADLPGGGLAEGDFDVLTGEPNLNSTVTAKISALGKAYCASKKVRQGGAFGEFRLEPYGNDTNDNETIYGIVDSSRDFAQVGNTNVGYTAFMQGFRWNHHLYCDD